MSVDSLTKSINNLSINNHLIHNINSKLTDSYKQDIINKIYTIEKIFKNKDGSGLNSGIFTEMIFSECFKTIFGNDFEIYNKSENDFKLFTHPLSFKKIKGKSTIALDWSKNKKTSEKEYFCSNILILNTETQQWWKKGPLKKNKSNINYTRELPIGLYLIEKEFCKENIKFTSNNKTNTQIIEPFLYEMLYNSLDKNLFIKFPEKTKILNFNIIKAFF